MIRTITYEFNGIDWIAVAEFIPCERGHGHWYNLRRLHAQADRSCFVHDCEYRTWRGDDIASRPSTL